jgi:HPr kinase/phosphorylase
MLQVNVTRLHEDNREALGLSWIAGHDGSAAVRREAAASAALVGHLNLTHPNSVQVLGEFEASAFAGTDAAVRKFIDGLFASQPAAVVLADGIPAPNYLIEVADARHMPVLSTGRSAVQVIEKLSRYLAKALADSTERHGVFMDVLGLGVLITGDSGVGKSELALELISRGHGLVADDVVDISRLAANTLEGRCPPLLKDFLEVRGLGLLNIRTIFGETAVRPKMKLKLIAHLARPNSGSPDLVERLPLAELSEVILGVTVRKVMIPVAAGRNLAVLLEAAVRDYILKLRGIDSNAEFADRQRKAMQIASAQEDGGAD